MSPLKRLTTTPMAAGAVGRPMRPRHPRESAVLRARARSRDGHRHVDRVPRHRLPEAEVLVVELVAELLALGLQIAAVLGVRRDLDRDLFDDGEAEALDARSSSSGCS